VGQLRQAKAVYALALLLRPFSHGGRTTPKYNQDHGRGLAGLPGISSGSRALRIAPGRASHFLKLDIRVFAIEV
jgi:hypothetical protein